MAGGAGSQQVDEGPAGGVAGHGAAGTGVSAASRASVGRSSWVPCACGHRRGPQRHRGVAGHVDVVADGHLAVAQPQAAAQVAGSRRAPAERAGERAVDAGPGVVAGPGNGAGGLGQAAHEHVGVGVAQRRGDPVLLLQQQAVAGPAGAPVQLDPGTPATARRRRRGWPGRCPTGSTGPPAPSQRLHVAQAAPALLEVGLEQEGHLARPRVALAPGSRRAVSQRLARLRHCTRPCAPARR